MLDLKRIREDPEGVRAALGRRGEGALRGRWTGDRARRASPRAAARARGAARRAERGQRTHPQAADAGEREREIEAMRAVAARAKELEQELGAVEASFRRPSRRCRTCPIRRPRPGPRTSWSARSARPASWDSSRATICELAGELIDMDRAASLSGSRFAYLQRRPRDARAGARALGAGEGPRAWLRARHPARAGARAGALRHRLPARHRAADLRAAPRTSSSSSAPRRSRSPRCTTARSSRPSVCRFATRASRRAFVARRGRPAGTPAGSSACTSSTRSRCSASSRPRSRRRARADPRDRGGDPERRSGCPTAW